MLFFSLIQKKSANNTCNSLHLREVRFPCHLFFLCCYYYCHHYKKNVINTVRVGKHRLKVSCHNSNFMMAQQNQAHLNLRDHNLQCYYSPRQKPLVRERLILKSKLFEWMNWTTSCPELIPWFLSSVELSSKRAGREWNCHVVFANDQLFANRVVDAYILLLRGYGACSVIHSLYAVKVLSLRAEGSSSLWSTFSEHTDKW